MYINNLTTTRILEFLLGTNKERVPKISYYFIIMISSYKWWIKHIF